MRALDKCLEGGAASVVPWLCQLNQKAMVNKSCGNGFKIDDEKSLERTWWALETYNMNYILVGEKRER